jgi:hypothetical protein
LGSNVKGSSLPNFSGTPNSLNFAVRAFCRWHASWTIWSLATVGFGLAAVVGDIGDIAVDVVVVAV